MCVPQSEEVAGSRRDKVVDINSTFIICSDFFVNDDKNSINDANCDRYVEEATREFRALQRCANGWALPVQSVS